MLQYLPSVDEVNCLRLDSYICHIRGNGASDAELVTQISFFNALLLLVVKINVASLRRTVVCGTNEVRAMTYCCTAAIPNFYRKPEVSF